MLLSKNEIIDLLRLDDFSKVTKFASDTTKNNFNNDIFIRGLLEFSNHCKRKCKYCGINCYNTDLKRFRMSPEEIISVSNKAADAGYKTIVLQSGEDEHYSPLVIGNIITKIKEHNSNTAITLSVGEQSRDIYKYWRDCGADRYLLKHETANPILYKELHPDSNLNQRLRCLYDLKDLGYATGGGFMIGLPTQTLSNIADDLLTIASIPCDMAGIGPFIPSPHTPLKDASEGSASLTLKVVSLARIMLPKAFLPATTSLGVIDPKRKSEIFSCGANVIMRKITPNQYRKLYEIYPSSLKEDSIISSRKEVCDQIKALGKNPI